MIIHINTSYYISYIPYNILLTIDMNQGQSNKDPAINSPKQNSPRLAYSISIIVHCAGPVKIAKTSTSTAAVRCRTAS